MVDNTDLFLFYQIGLIIIFATLASELFKKIKLPGLLGVIMVGLFFGGPGSLGILFDSNELKILGNFGAILLLFVAGLQFDAEIFLKMGKKAFFLTSGGVLLSIVLGMLLGSALQMTFQESFLLGVMISPSGTSVISSILVQRKLLDSDLGSLTLAAAVIDDVIAIIVFSILSSTLQGTSPQVLDIAFSTIVAFVFVIGSIYLGNKLLPRLITRIEKFISDDIISILFLGIGLIIAFIGAVYFKLAAITGAFIVGAIIPYHTVGKSFDDKLRLMKDVFVAIFFTSIGISINPTNIPAVIPLAFLVLAVAIGARFIGGLIGGLISKAKRSSVIPAAIGLSIRGEVSLIIAQEGISQGIVGEEFMILTFLIIFGSILLLFPLFIRFITPRGSAESPQNSENANPSISENLGNANQ